MTSFINEKYLNYESKIVWRKNVQDIRFVRMASTDFAYRKGLTDEDRKRIEISQELIGYADLDDDAPLEHTISLGGDDCYLCDRRIFVLRHGDLENYKQGCPVEAVDPLTVQPKVMGHQTKRTKGSIATES